MSQSSSDVIFAYLESANMSIPTFRQYFVQFRKRIIGNLCTVRKCFWHSATYNTATASLPLFLRYGRLSDHHFTVKPAKMDLLLLRTLYRVVPNDIYVPSLYRWITCFWHCYVLYRAPAKPQHFRHDRRLRDFDLKEITVDFVVKSRSL